MPWRADVPLLALVLASSACSLRSMPPGKLPVDSIDVPEEASSYLTDARPDGALGGDVALRLERTLAKTLVARGERAQADGALGSTACWVLREAHRRRPVDAIGAEVAARHFGFGGVTRGTLVFDARDEGVLTDQIERIPRNVTITRYGVCASPSGNSAAVALGSVEVSYAPIARSFDPGQSVSLKGEVAPRFRFARIYLTKPDGTVDDRPMKGRQFDVTFRLDAPGRYRLEVMGDGPAGPEIASNVPLYVGVAEPPIEGTAGVAVDPEQTEQRMLALLNHARQAAGVAPVAADPELRELALGHTKDMVEHHFFAHVSPSTGSPEDRLRRSGALVADFGENIANAGSPEEAHQVLMDSPGHRANMLRPEFTHVGIAALESELGVAITMSFARRPSAAAVPTNAAQVRAAILALRRSAGLPPASVDAVYDAAAQAGADAWAKGTDETGAVKAIGDAQQRAVERLHASRPAACVTFGALLELGQLQRIAAISQPSVKRFGVGARLKKDEKGVRLATVIVLEGASCQ